MSASTSARVDPEAADADGRQAHFAASRAEDAFPVLPTEAEIYILPDGRVIVADLPAELAAMVEELGEIENR